jgi:hypothetical protein
MILESLPAIRHCPAKSKEMLVGLGQKMAGICLQTTITEEKQK